MENKLEIGRTYKMSGFNVICVGYTKKGYAKMQTLGMASGKWSGEGNISNYNDTTKAFTTEWEGIVRKFKLPTKKQAIKNKLIKDALAKAASNYSSFGASFNYSWLGTVDGSNFAWYVNSGGYVYNGNSYQSNSYVVAPAFNLDTSKIILDGDEIRKKDTTEEQIIIKKTETFIEHDIIVDGIKVGTVELCPERSEISRLVIFEPYQNKGYGTEVVRSLLKQGYKSLWVRSDNPRAIHVYEKCGFIKGETHMFEMKYQVLNYADQDTLMPAT